MVMKSTPLTDTHVELGAKMVEFAGYNMPVYYDGIIQEHKTVREQVGVFDVSHMGEFILRGKDASIFLQRVTTNDISKMYPGKAQYNCLPNDKGGIVDDLLVYRLDQNMQAGDEAAYMLVVNAANIDKDWDWLQQHKGEADIQLINISDQTGLLAIQGPQALDAVQRLTDTDLKALSFYTFTRGQFAGVDNVIISATGYTGAGGLELYAEADKMPRIWKAVFEAGAEYGIKPVGLGARDTLRLEMGMCLYGNDIDDTTSPLEARLGWITKLDKGDFIGRDIFARQKEEGVSRKLMGFTVQGSRRVPRHGYVLENEAGVEIGYVTSGTQSPSLGYPIGMGYIQNGFNKPGQTVYVVAGKKRIEAEVTRPPFLPKG